MSEPKTVKVRIAVAVDVNGKWYAEGFATSSSKSLRDAVGDTFLYDMEGQPNHVIHWITAEVPLPEEGKEIEGTVE